MTITDYFVLTNSDASLIKRFKVIYGSYKPILQKAETVNRTLEGKKDVARGGVYEIHNYVCRIPYQVSDSNYGTLDDFKTFFSYNNPNGTPSDKLIITTHYGNQWYCIFTGQFSPDALGIMIDGDQAVYIVPCTFEFLGEVV